MSWEKVKLGEVIKHRKGSILIDDEKEYKLCRVQLHRRGVVLREIIKGSAIRTKKQQVCKAGDFLVAEMDAKVGGYGFVPKNLEGAIVSSHYFLFELDESKINPKYLEVVSQLQILQDQIKAVGSTNYAAIRPVNVLNWEIPITDIEHQNKIVELFETTKEKGNSLSTELTHQLDLVKKLRQQFLQEAVQGKLIKNGEWTIENGENTEGVEETRLGNFESSPNVTPAADETGAQLLARIKAEKAKTGKKEKPLPLIKEDEIPFEIPDNWVWCRLGEICSKITDGFHNTPPKSKNGFPYIAATHVKSEKIDWKNCDYVEEKYHRELFLKASPVRGEVLVVNIGAGCATPAIIDVDYEFSFKNVAILKFNQQLIFNQYLYFFFLLTRPYIYKELTKGGLQPFLSLKILNEILIPLPPLSIQAQIVAKVEELMGLCDALEASIQDSKGVNEALLQQVLREALAG